MRNYPPLFLKNQSTKDILNEVKNLIPRNTQVYLFGGTVRNALYYEFFNEEIQQRDFDCIVIGDGETFAQNLFGSGFLIGKKNSRGAKILKKARISDLSDNFDDWVYLDCKIYESDRDIESILQKISDLTISGVALDLNESNDSDWMNKVRALPFAIEDLKKKQLRVVNLYPVTLYKIIRLISAGFKQPSEREIQNSFKKLKEIDKDTFLRDKEKTIRYVGGEEKVLEIARNMGIESDILNFKTS
jgi:hypothetical protein